MKRSISTSRHARAVGVVEERRAAAACRVEIHAGRGVEAALAEGDALEVGTCGQLLRTSCAARARGRRRRRRRRTRRARRRRRRRRCARSSRRRHLPGARGCGGRRRRRRRRSGPRALDAAVGEVLLFFSVVVGIDDHASSRSTPSSSATSCADLRVHALAHLRRAGRHLHACRRGRCSPARWPGSGTSC